MAVKKGPTLNNRNQLVGTPAMDFYLKLRKAAKAETLEIMVEALERQYRGYSNSVEIARAWEVRRGEIGA